MGGGRTPTAHHQPRRSSGGGGGRPPIGYQGFPYSLGFGGLLSPTVCPHPCKEERTEEAQDGVSTCITTGNPPGAFPRLQALSWQGQGSQKPGGSAATHPLWRFARKTWN